MVGITLSPQQIHQAPPEVRRWIEQQIGDALGLSRTAPTVEAPPKHLVCCRLEEARAILPMITGLLPVVSVSSSWRTSRSRYPRKVCMCFGWTRCNGTAAYRAKARSSPAWA